MPNLDSSQTVASVVLDHSECAPVFQRHRIDFCCRGDVSVAHAAEARGIDVAALMKQLERAIAERRGDDRVNGGVSELSTSALIDRIVDTHHAYVRKALPFVRGLATKVARVHGDHNPKLRALEAAVEELAETLLGHLDEEERTLFPTLKRAEQRPSDAAKKLLSEMHEEHLAVGGLLEAVRDASDDFAVPEWACGSYRALFGELEALEADVFRHVHLENHVLKPRFERGAVETVPHATRVLRVELAMEAAALAASAAYRDRGHSAKTLLKREDSRLVLIAMRAGARIQEHKTDHTITVQTLSGRVQLNTPDESADLPAKTMLFLEAAMPHDVVAKEDSVVLLTINWHSGHESRLS